MNDDNKYGKRLKELRQKYGYSQEELAKLLNVTRSRISNYEQGIREPDLEMQETLADFFNVTLDYLFGNSTMSLADQLREISDSPEDIDEFISLYKEFRQASPETRNSLLTTLRSTKADS